jgi:lipopolysaccharide export system ATP-binding protein
VKKGEGRVRDERAGGGDVAWHAAAPSGAVSPVAPRAVASEAAEDGPKLRPDRAGLVARDLTKQFRGRRVVDGVSLDIAPGEIVGLLGPNGAGKTTSFHLILGLVPPNAGRVSLDGHDITTMPMYLRARRGVGYLPQEASIFRRMTVEENLLSILEMRGVGTDESRRQCEELLQEFGLTAVARSLGLALSGGERRRAEIARALASEPRYMMLDEPFAGIDPIAVVDLQRVVVRLKKKGIGVLITDHNVRETLQITDHAYIISQGKIFRDGTPAELASDSEVRKVYLGEHFRLH